MSKAGHAPARGRSPTIDRVVVEPDADVWRAWCPVLKAYGAAA